MDPHQGSIHFGGVQLYFDQNLAPGRTILLAVTKSPDLGLCRAGRVNLNGNKSL